LRRRGYIQAMTRPASIQGALALAAAAVALSAVTGLAFAGWLGHGADIFLSLAQSGLSWCF
jgi:hypothetical protein